MSASKYLTFSLGDEECGINIRNITEIIGLQKITEMPDAPPYVRGVINLRGKVIPILDMRLRFGVDEREYDDRTCIIVVMVDNISVGLIVDTVAEVLDIEHGNIDPRRKSCMTDRTTSLKGWGVSRRMSSSCSISRRCSTMSIWKGSHDHGGIDHSGTGGAEPAFAGRGS